jgi:hypothetical protein
MAVTPEAAPTVRAHKAATRSIYAWGEGQAEGNGRMRELLEVWWATLDSNQ